MCEYFSCIITKNMKVRWLKNSVQHEDIIEHAQLEDKKLKFRDLVRIEIIPKDRNKVTRNPKDWQFKIDEEPTLPEWFIENQKKAEKQCWLAWEKSVQINLALDEEETEVTDTYVLACGSSHVLACGSSHVEACGSSHVRACGSSHVRAWGSSHVRAWGSSHVEAFGSSHVEACGSSHVRAWGSSHVRAWGSSHVEAFGSSHVEAFGSSHVRACGSSHVRAWGSSHVEACDSSHVEACGSSHVEACDSSHVEAFGSSHVEIYSKRAVMIRDGKIFVHENATVLKTQKKAA